MKIGCCLKQNSYFINESVSTSNSTVITICNISLSFKISGRLKTVRVFGRNIFWNKKIGRKSAEMQLSGCHYEMVI